MNESIRAALNHILRGQTVPRPATEAAFAAIMDGECSEIDIAALLMALRVRGEEVEEIAGAAAVMRQRATRIKCRSEGLLDTCGTGGDGFHTFNISTATAFVAAAAGVPVAKHGNRSVSSSSGSADVLEALGINLQLSPEQVGKCIDEVGIGFCFAPLLHSAMKNVVPVRKALGIRTIFNLLGPLTNPAGAGLQLLGANKTRFAEKLARVLYELGCKRALVVCGNDEFDEVSLWGKTAVFDVSPEGVEEYTWKAEHFGLSECTVSDLQVPAVDGADASAARIRDIVDGKLGPSRDIVVANAAAALIAAGQALGPSEGATLAAEAIDSGRAKDVLTRLSVATNAMSADK
ncbi:MAG: anthranilate phosphoribosyltransferase [Planctomycetota bacterium]|nr:anthranilate phosphoribosyltransferase [Planctomycetota bacterium]MDA0920958.1 anthranilate phosphoribosyltransferase [Planctomycetota bacterium]MDA1161173.1 anthranilate phosphoribosyltransferase [Planctomycetota bacterium]